MKNPTVMETRFNAARDQLVKQASVNPERIGAVGYCFGGDVNCFSGCNGGGQR